MQVQASFHSGKLKHGKDEQCANVKKGVWVPDLLRSPVFFPLFSSPKAPRYSTNIADAMIDRTHPRTENSTSPKLTKPQSRKMKTVERHHAAGPGVCILLLSQLRYNYRDMIH